MEGTEQMYYLNGNIVSLRLLREAESDVTGFNYIYTLTDRQTKGLF